MPDSQERLQDLTLSVGDLVRYQQWRGRITHILSDGTASIDFTGHNPIFDTPFFRGPFWPYELERVDA
jgi:hypothetical protein